MRARFLPLLALFACAPPAAAPIPTPPPPAPTPTAGNEVADAGVEPCEGETFGLAAGMGETVAARFAKRRGTMATTKKTMVATSHHLATEAALAVLRGGGNAVDAYVAATLVDDVVLPGVTSTAGLAGALVYEAKTKKLTYVHGGLADPIDPARRWKDERVSGKLVLVPGAPAAYAELTRRFGKWPLSKLVEPAAKIATDGFALDGLYAGSIAAHRAKLEASEYGKKTFFRDGKPIAKGEPLKLVELGATLRSYGRDSSWFYKGGWARDAVKLANEHGGTLAAKDFAGYAAEVATPMHGRFMGHDLYAAGHGGVKVLVSLAAYDLLRGSAPPESPSASPEALARLLDVQNATKNLPMLHDRELVTRGSASDAEITRLAAEVAARVRARKPAVAGPAKAGTHSSSVVVVDAEGNIVVGTHTIETLNWGEGLFVGGVPLSTAAAISFDEPAKAKMRTHVDPLSATIALKDGAPVLALAVYGSGLHPADVQILDAVIGRGLDPESAVLEPRVGYYGLDIHTNAIDDGKSAVDPRFRRELLCTMKERGYTLERSMVGVAGGFVDTGFPTLVTIAPGTLRGMTPDPFFIEGVAAGE